MRQRIEAWADIFGGVGLALLAATGIFFALGQPRERVIVLGILGVIFIALYAWARPQQVRATMMSRGARYGSNAVLVSILFVVLIGMLNFLSGRYNNRSDLTSNKSQSLSDQTIEALKALKEPIKATAFFSTQRTDPQALTDAQDRLRQYAQYSDKFTYRFVDPQRDLQIAEEYKVQLDGTIVLERGTRRENVLSSDEQALTNAILKVTQDKQPVLYFVTGHGEHSPEDSGETGYSSLKTQLEEAYFKTSSLNLRTVTSTLPSDLGAMIIAGPKQKFEADEVQRVKDYLDKNGRALILIDPATETGLEPVLKTWGIALRNDEVIDLSSSLPGRPLFIAVASYKGHPTSQGLTGYYLVLPGARSLMADSAPSAGHSASPLFSSSPDSWGESDFNSLKNQNPQFDPNADARGPLDLAFASETLGENPARVIAIGNSTFPTNGILRQVPGTVNDFMFVNVVKWLAGQDKPIVLPPKPSASTPLNLTQEKGIWVLVSSCLLLPGAILVIGALVWWRRR